MLIMRALSSIVVHNEIIKFLIIDVKKSISSMIDGIKKSKRKILFCSFYSNFVEVTFWNWPVYKFGSNIYPNKVCSDVSYQFVE